MATKTEAAHIYLQLRFVSNCTQICENQFIAAVPAIRKQRTFRPDWDTTNGNVGYEDVVNEFGRTPWPECAVDMLQHSEPFTIFQFQCSTTLLLGGPVTCRPSPPHKQTCTRAQHSNCDWQQVCWLRPTRLSVLSFGPWAKGAQIARAVQSFHDDGVRTKFSPTAHSSTSLPAHRCTQQCNRSPRGLNFLRWRLMSLSWRLLFEVVATLTFLPAINAVSLTAPPSAPPIGPLTQGPCNCSYIT